VVNTFTFLQSADPELLRAQRRGLRELRVLIKCYLYDMLSEDARPIRVVSVRRVFGSGPIRFSVTVRGPAKATRQLKEVL